METDQQVYIDGQLVSAVEAKISVFDRAVLYGDGVFEGIRVYAGSVFLLKEHLVRLYDSARTIRLEMPIAFDEMTRAVNDTVKANAITDGYVRLIVTRGSGSLGLDITQTSNPQVIIIAATIKLYPDEYYENGLQLVTASTIRNHPQALSPRTKSLNYLNNCMALSEAADAGCVEALMLNHKGEVSECTGDNIFVIKNGTLKTPPPDAGILEGLTRAAVIKLARESGRGAHEVTLNRHDVYTADECFLTGTAAEVVPVVKVDGRIIGNGKPGPITQDLWNRFRTFTQNPDAAL